MTYNVTMNKDNSFLLKFTEYTFYLFFLLFPFINFQSFLYGGTSVRAIALVFIGTILGLFFSFTILSKQNSLTFPKSPIIYAIGAYFLGLVISALFGLDPSTSFWSVATRMTGIWYFLNLGIFMYLLWVYIVDRKVHRNIILCIIFSTVVYSILFLLGREGFNLIFKNYFGDAFTFGNSSFAAMYIFGVFILSLYYLFQSTSKKWWMYLLPVLLVINPNILNKNILFGDFSKGFIGQAQASTYAVLLSLFGIFVIWLISKIKEKKTRNVVSYSLFGLFVIGVVFSAFSLLSSGGLLQNAYLERSSAARPLVWEMSKKMISQRPLLGWGTDNFERVFELNFDNRLLQDEYGNEMWFDRAHNVLIDQTVDNGLLGLSLYLFVYLVVILSLIYVALNSKDRPDQIFASMLFVYFSLHFAELQTAFDTTISYPLVAFMIISAVVLFNRTISETKKAKIVGVVSPVIKYVIVAILFVFFIWSLFFGIIPFVRTQLANGYIRTVGSAAERIPWYETLFNSPVDKHAFLWRTSTDFQRGIAANPAVLADPGKVAKLKEEIVIFENEYRNYIKDNPNNFRARLNLADILIYQMLFQVNKLEEAQNVLDGAIKLVPQSPQPYWMKAVAYVYMRKFDLAREYAQKGVELNPKIKQSQEIVKYVENSIKTFPDINLFFFRQI